MRIIIMLLFAVFLTNTVRSQELKLEMDSIKISGIIYEKSDKISVSEGKGPFFSISVRVYNSMYCPVTFFPSTAEFSLNFYHDFIKYEKRIFPLAFMDNEEIILMPGEEIDFKFDELIFVGTPIYYTRKNDYSIDLIKIMSTLEFVYKDPDHFLYTRGIKNVCIE